MALIPGQSWIVNGNSKSYLLPSADLIFQTAPAPPSSGKTLPPFQRMVISILILISFAFGAC